MTRRHAKPRAEPTVADTDARSAISQAGRFAHDHPSADYPRNEFQHLIASIRQANRGRCPQLLRECRDVLLLMLVESPVNYSSSRAAKARAVTRETLEDAEAWLENIGMEAPSPIVTERIEKAGL